jgi:hypothetical protein
MGKKKAKAWFKLLPRYWFGRNAIRQWEERVSERDYKNTYLPIRGDTFTNVSNLFDIHLVEPAKAQQLQCRIKITYKMRSRTHRRSVPDQLPPPVRRTTPQLPLDLPRSNFPSDFPEKILLPFVPSPSLTLTFLSRGPKFKFMSRNWLSLGLSWFSSVPPQKYRSSVSFPIHSLMIQTSDTKESKILTGSLNKPQINNLACFPHPSYMPKQP